MEIKKITTEVGIGYISGAEENQIRSLEPARKEFYEAFIKFSESLSGLGDANLLKKHVGFVANKIIIGYKDGEKKSYTAYGFIKAEETITIPVSIPLVMFGTQIIKTGILNKEGYKKITKGIIIAGIISVIAYIFIPSRGTMYKMLAASYMTQENIENVGESIDKIANKLVEKINQVKK